MIKARILLDTCSTVNFMTEDFANLLKLPKKKCCVAVGAVNQMETKTKHSITATIKSTKNDFKTTIEFLTIPCISEASPSETVERDVIKLPKNIKLADPNFHKAAPVDMLLASGPTLSMLSVGQINLHDDTADLYLQKTVLGWVIGGYLTAEKTNLGAVCKMSEVTYDLEKFWRVEEGPTDAHYSEEETACEKHYVKNTTRNADGRYIVALPFKTDPSVLGKSRAQACKQLHALAQRFKKNPILEKDYTAVINEYLELGHMSEVPAESEETGYTMPHHAVIKTSSKTTKTRTVMNASQPTDSALSLNNILMVGPTIQEDLLVFLLRFRLHQYVVSADIEKMYRQILVREDDRKYQKILWLRDGKTITLQINTVAFGLACAPFLAIRSLQQLADDEGEKYPRAAKIVKKDFYVDNLLTGSDTIEDAREIRKEITELLKLGGFNLRQWASNDERVLTGLRKDQIETNFELDRDQTIKTLGISWNATQDAIQYFTNPICNTQKRSKRAILSEIAKIFDPLGLLGPVILYAKGIMQDIWRLKLNWDESVPSSLNTAWTEFCEQLPLINGISFNRKVILENANNIQLHGFADASQKGYGACLYVRSVDANGKIECNLYCAKSRVAPLKSVSIPRLELCAAVLLVKLYQQVTKGLNIKFDKVTLWSDSSITLHWIKTAPSLLKVFVANRVSEIQNATKNVQWRHVRSEDNPADALSRGQRPGEFLKNYLWVNGPDWLKKDEAQWPEANIPGLSEEMSEVKKNACLLATDPPNEEQKRAKILQIFEKFSSYEKLKRFVACFKQFSREKTLSGQLTVQDLRDAERTIIKRSQQVYFSKEIHDIENNKDLKRTSKLLSLSPFVDTEGIMRVGGRLKNAALPYSQRHPMLLPKSNHLSDIIIRSYHQNLLHAGSQITLCTLRQKFWLIDGRDQVRKIIKRCVTCVRADPPTTKYVMADLPSIRVNQARAFYNVGIDYCGPFFIKEKKYRNTKKIKVYVAVFVCLVVKAIHLELVSDLTTEGFLAALERFMVRRGKPKNIYSDNGTNFVGANNELKELYELVKSNEHNGETREFLASQEIVWHFTPPLSPHFGGLWESAVRSFKKHMKRVATDLLFTFEELNTFVIAVEGILNSRPLTPMSNDPNDLSVLTPAHFLIGEPLTSLPGKDYTDIRTNRLSQWQHIQKMRDHFWKRWHKEYLHELNIRNKWKTGKHSICKGSIVLLRDDNVPSMRWSLGRVIDVHPGTDGIVRAATVKTATSEFKRCVKKLALLPIETHNVNDNKELEN